MSEQRVGTSSTNQQRIGWADSARGFGIILVVFGHVLRGAVASNAITLTPTARFTDTWIYAFHMPLFFFISGLFLSRSAEKSAQDFARDKISTIAYPYFVWSLVTLLIKSSLGEIVNQPRTLTEIPDIFYRPIEQFWFLYVLFLLSVVFGFLLKFGIKPWALLALAAVFYPGVLPLPWSGWEPFEFARFHSVYLVLGIIAAGNGIFSRVADAGARKLAAVAVVGFLIVAAFAACIENPQPGLLEVTAALSGIVATVAVAVLVDRAKIDSAISFLGRYSLEIFVAHTMTSAAVRICFQQILHISAPAPYIVTGTIAGLYGPILLALLLKRIGLSWAYNLPRRSHPRNLEHAKAGTLGE